MGDDKQPYRWWEHRDLGADELCVIHAGIVEPGSDLAVWREHRLEERFGVNSRTFQEYGQKYRDRPYLDLQKLRKRLGQRACELHNVDLGEEDPKKAAALLTLFEVMATCAKDATRVKAAREVSNYFVVKMREREAKHKEELHLLDIEQKRAVKEAEEKAQQEGRVLTAEDVVTALSSAAERIYDVKI